PISVVSKQPPRHGRGRRPDHSPVHAVRPPAPPPPPPPPPPPKAPPPTRPPRISTIKQRPQLPLVTRVGVIRDPGLDPSPELSVSRHLHHSIHSAPTPQHRQLKDRGRSGLTWKIK